MEFMLIMSIGVIIILAVTVKYLMEDLKVQEERVKTLESMNNFLKTVSKKTDWKKFKEEK